MNPELLLDAIENIDKSYIAAAQRRLGYAAGPEHNVEPARLVAAAVAMRRSSWRVARGILIAAILCAACMAAALAVSPTLRDALVRAMGSFASYSQEVDNASAIDQGIRVTAVRAIADESGGKAYLELQDLTGDRLTASTYLCTERTVTPLAFDQETRTLLVEVNLDSGPQDKEATIAISEIWGGQEFTGILLPVGLTEPDNILETIQLPQEDAWSADDDRVVLAPGQTPEQLEGIDGFTLSSMGFDGQDRLHIQIELEEGYQVPQWEYYPLDASSALRQIGLVLPVVHFLEDGRYVDFQIDPINPGEEHPPREVYQGLQFALGGWLGTRERTAGNWTLTFPLETLPARTVSIGQMVYETGTMPSSGQEETYGKVIESLTLSAMSATLTVTPGEEPQPDEQREDRAYKECGVFYMPLAVYLADGTSFTVELGSPVQQYTEEVPCSLDRWQYPYPVDPAEVIAVAIGSWYLPLDGDTALPGCLLEETSR